MTTAGMEEIKDLVSHALEQKRVLSRLKAELRAQVFIAIDEQERGAGNPGLAQKTENARRAALLKNEHGPLIIGLVKEFLEWSGMEFTLRVFEPEIGQGAADTSVTRQTLAKKLGISEVEVGSDKPLLEMLINQRQSNKQGLATTQQTMQTVTTKPQSTPLSSQSVQQQQQQLPQQPQSTSRAVTSAPQTTQLQEASTTSLISDINDDENLQNADDEEEDYAAVFTHQRETRASISADGDVSHNGPAAGAANQQPGMKPTTTLQQDRRSVEFSGSELQGHRRTHRTTRGVSSSDDDSEYGSDAKSSPRHDAARRSHDGGKHHGHPPATTAAAAAAAGTTGNVGITMPGKLNALNVPPALPTRLGALAPLTTAKSPGGISDGLIGGRKDAEDIKAELRKAGLLNSDSYSHDVRSSHASDDDEDDDDESIGSLELPDSSQQAAVRHSSSGGGTSSDSGFVAAHVPARRLSNSSGLSGLAPPPPSKPLTVTSGTTAAAHGVIRPVHGGVFDAEVTISQSMEIPADLLENDEGHDDDGDFTDDSEAMSRPSGPGGKYHSSKGVSMDLKQTGLSASDRSGDLDTVLEHADLQETAEWA